MSNLHDALIAEAEKWIGVRESGGANKGPEVEMFQKAVDGKAQGESWCMAFVQFCLMKVEANLGIRTNVYHSEHCLTVWNKTDNELHRMTPQPGYIVIWRNGKTTSGHTGIVSKINEDGKTIETIEGNTGDGQGVVREGDGVYRRKRNRQPLGEMQIVGYIDPFAQSVIEG